MNVTASITLKKQSLPANPAASDNVRFTIATSQADGNTFTQEQTAVLPATTVTFTSVPDGRYRVLAQRMSTDTPPQPVGSAAESFVNVVNPVDVDVPDTMSVSLG